MDTTNCSHTGHTHGDNTHVYVHTVCTQCTYMCTLHIQ